MHIGKHEIGPGHPVYICAEGGASHNGSVHKAILQMRLAHDAGATAFKLQKRTLPDAIPESQRDVMKDSPWGTLDYVAYREKLEFGQPEYGQLFDVAAKVGIDFFVSVWDEAAVDFMEQFDPIAYKVPSACLTDDALLRRLAASGRPVILSTGMSDTREVAKAYTSLIVASVLPMARDDILMCQCTSVYPCPPAEVNLRTMAGLPSQLKGYSGHELGTAISIAAVALGACYIERHFTSDKTMWGSDQAMSLEPHEFKAMVDGIREVEAALGNGQKRVYESELDSMQKLRRFPTPSVSVAAQR